MHSYWSSLPFWPKPEITLAFWMDRSAHLGKLLWTDNVQGWEQNIGQHWQNCELCLVFLALVGLEQPQGRIWFSSLVSFHSSSVSNHIKNWPCTYAHKSSTEKKATVGAEMPNHHGLLWMEALQLFHVLRMVKHAHMKLCTWNMPRTQSLCTKHEFIGSLQGDVQLHN